MNPKKGGQIIIGAIVLLLILTILIPAIVSYLQRESSWTVKEMHATRAFELAEAGIERGYQQLILSTTTISNLQNSQTLQYFNFDQAYSDLPGGTYEVRMTGNSVAQTITITSVGRDTMNKEVRAIEAIYETPGAYPAAIYAINSASILGNPTVEWGPVSSPGPITTDSSHIYPRYYSSGLITPFDTNGASPPNTDNLQWWDYYNLPPAAQIDLQAYKTAAQTQSASCVDNSNCLGTTCVVCYYTAANYATFNPGTNNYFDNGSATALIVEGNLTLQGNYGNGSKAANTVPIPTTAWKEYGSTASSNAAWAHYLTFDSYASAHYPTYQDAVTANYVASSSLTDPFAMTKVFMRGFLYIGGTVSITGGGNGIIIGSMYCATVANLGSSHVTVYYDSSVIPNIKIKNSALSRTSWEELTSCSWPSSSANPTCH